VFAFFVPQRLTYWYGREMHARLEVQGGVAELSKGLRVRVRGRLAKRELEHTACVTRCEWGQVLEWEFEDGYGVKGMERWELEPSEAGGTCVRMISAYEMPNAVARVVNALVTKHSVARRNREYLERLKRLLEKQ
jgi:uncharacterized membrane protein